MSETAQQTYKRFLRDHLAPALREIGLKGSGNAFVLPHDTAWIQVGFQGNRYSDAHEVRFTINMAIASKAECPEIRRSATGVGVNWRVAPIFLGHDKWWAVRPGQDLDELAADIASLIRDSALPWALRNLGGPGALESEAQAPARIDRSN